VAVAAGALPGTGGAARVDPGADVAEDALVGPGCVVGPGCRVESGARVWNSVLADCTVGPGACVERCLLEKTVVGRGSTLRSSRASGLELGELCSVDCAGASLAVLAARSTLSAFADLREVRSGYPVILGGGFEGAELDTVLMSMHMAGDCRHVKAVPTVVRLDDREVPVRAVPMIGGGAVLRGSSEEPVTLECCFIGSNAVIEPGSHLSYGCFVLGRPGPGAGLLPLTLTTGEPATHRIGGVLDAVPSTVITHFINWTFQACGPQCAPAVAVMTAQAIQTGVSALEVELARRERGGEFEEEEALGHYRSLPAYSEGQLRSGLETYRRALESGAWDLEFDGSELVFRSARGRWTERGGAAFWETLPGE
jgi:carbonic anhydrase/acetyltransferase-like protein (isoleucine patch superfamily)